MGRSILIEMFAKVSLVDKMKSEFWPQWEEEIEEAKKERIASTK